MVNKNTYLIAGIITLTLVIISLYVGYNVEVNTYNQLHDQMLENSMEGESYLLLTNFLEDKEIHGNNDNMTDTCKILKSMLDKQSAETSSLYNQVYRLETSTIISDKKKYNLLRKQYFLANFRLYLSYKSYIEKCGANNDNLQLILFFYTAEEECPDCIVQGRVLDTLRQNCKNVRVFAFPTDVNMNLLDVMKMSYKIDRDPTVIIDNKDVIFEGLTSYAQIRRYINVCK
ncbi:hypothetical protein J7J26_03495 [Candidatus Micrarchaeota archaeon]|nr:hypothetical protein [Candidatus Micrarchaeota archaeon]